jgi:CBS domain-containing protein
MPLALHLLASRQIGALVVSSDAVHVEGLLCERDVVRSLTRHGAAMLGLRVRHVMTGAVPLCAPDDSIATVMATMTRTRRRHVPVVREGRLCGIVSIGDLVKRRLDELELEASVLREAYLAVH